MLSLQDIGGVSWQMKGKTTGLAGKIELIKIKGGMGFRDLQAFKLNMLVRQSWRLIHHSQSLFFQIYKARYFPKCSFMKVEIGHYTSYVWSLLAAREVIFAGSWCCVSDGRNIKVMSINGFPTLRYWLDRFRLPCVWDLINVQTKRWDRGKLQEFFAPSTRQEILALPLSNLDLGDPLIGNKIKLKFSLWRLHTRWHSSFSKGRELDS